MERTIVGRGGYFSDSVLHLRTGVQACALYEYASSFVVCFAVVCDRDSRADARQWSWRLVLVLDTKC